jgi:hypothetical protein
VRALVASSFSLDRFLGHGTPSDIGRDAKPSEAFRSRAGEVLGSDDFVQKGETGGPLLEVAGTAERLGEPPQVPRGCWEQHYVPAHNPRAVLLRQKPICDNKSHHVRENQQCREGFSDHWPR